VNWGRPFQLSSHFFSQPDSQPIQIECGWSFSSALLKNGEVLVWWPRIGVLSEEVDMRSRSMDESGIGEAKQRDDTIPCHTWSVAVDPVLLPSLPPLPDIADIGENFWENPPRLIEIAGMDSTIIGLTDYGHVLRFQGLDHEGAVGTLGWQYVCSQIGLLTSLIFVIASRI
jgi:SCF-associated factor 1